MRGLASRSTREVEFKQLRQSVFFGNVRGPAVGGGHGGVEIAMGVDEPLRALIVEVGQRALAQLRGRHGVFRQDAVGIAEDDFRLDAHEIGRVEPRVAQLVEALRGLGDRDRARIVDIIFRARARLVRRRIR